MTYQGPFEQPHVVSGHERLGEEARNRRVNDQAIIENPLTHFTDEELKSDVTNFVARFYQIQLRLKFDAEKLLRAARVAKDVRLYDDVSRNDTDGSSRDLAVRLTKEEKYALRRERDVPLAERGMWTVVATVSLAAFLQGFSQSSFNGGALWDEVYHLNTASDDTASGSALRVTSDNWKLGAANASPFLAAALLGCPLALPVNHYLGRKGGVAVAAFLIMVTSLASAWARNWQELFGVRLVNGIGMGLKAVSTPILASETAVGFWRGTSILAWQLWVACGIAVGFAFNLIFSTSNDDTLTFGLIVASPLVPSLALLVVVVWFCDESPRFLMRKGTPKYNPAKAYHILLKVRHTELQALRDFYLIQKSIDQEEFLERDRPAQNRQLLFDRRLRNALISSSIVALAQQLCGINVLAFYSGTLFRRAGAGRETAMYYSLGFGAVNFFFCLPAIRTIDTLGRRKWLTTTLPIMAVMMACAALSFKITDQKARIATVALFLFLFAAAYSPGLGPIPFTIASEAFPLSHREAGAACAIAVNLGFAGLLSIFFPSINSGLGDAGSLGLFSGLNIVAFLLVFLLLEETKRRSLEDLDYIFAVSKRRFMRFQVVEILPWFLRRHGLLKDEPKPSLYRDYVWGAPPGNERQQQWRGGTQEPDEEAGSNVELPPYPPARRSRSVDSLHA